jgi:hypothetical protein
VVREAGHGMDPGGRADVLEHDVHATLAGQPAVLAFDVLGLMVNHFVGAQFAGFFEF